MRNRWVGGVLLALLAVGCRENLGPDLDSEALLTWEAQGLDGETVFSLVSGFNGRLFAVTQTGLRRRDQNTPNWVGTPRLGPSVWAVARTPQGWVASSRNGIYVSASDGEGWTRRHPSDDVLSLVFTSRGQILGGTGDGLVIRSNDTESWFVENVKDGAHLELFASDANGSSFTASVTDGVFHQFSGDWRPVLENEQVYALIGGRADEVIAGTWTSGVMRSTDSGSTWTIIGLQDRKVRSLLLLPDGGLLAGTMENGLYRLFPDDDDWVRENNGLPDAPVFALTLDAEGHLWVGLESDGVYRTATPLVFP